ncbi:arabinan endo-1,5-alpha-L-arabinosidase [Actinomyces sp. MRS3W]|uniref:arabinan endo-1,5-alpha-L-arabinosidase n=1 Tax=Actinomyces sp. MRS3W TaxID=2800796 RepID=UPI0028FD3B1F|nr:arabinan endo-1,5-alpha-L-arabinosidase [Actinomyces sp. MRS3W]MDU0348716.1 arabinan endo-1,5-alpha-L-arabinosidase [Actinomyces sp. MRS3W]
MKRRSLLGLGGLVASQTLLAATSGCAALDDRVAENGPSAQVPALAGDLLAHDPALLLDEKGQPLAVFSTGDASIAGGAILVRVSADGGTTWGRRNGAWSLADEPAWTHEAVPGLTNYWAPDVQRVGDEIRLYYAVSTFGSARSAIGLMANSSFDPAAPQVGWEDRGMVMSSGDGENYNAIDPSVLTDAEGRTWMAFGSFWKGIFAVELGEDGLRADPEAPPIHLADRGTALNDVEGAALTRHGDHYYLYLSFGTCCQGTESTYETAVGRAETITGPYLDRSGVPLLEGGGTVLLGSQGSMIGPGGGAVAGDWLVHHYYDADNGGAPTLALRKIAWDDDWPVLLSSEELRSTTQAPSA